MSALIRRDVCNLCDDIRVERDTGATYCAASPSGDCECAVALDQRVIEEIAPQIAALIHRISDMEVRRELAESAAGGFANALYLMHHAEFDDGPFLEACGVHVGVRT